MPASSIVARLLSVLLLGCLGLVAGCGRMPRLTEEDCMTRVMYFESNRSSPDGMLAVGTVVMNRLHSGLYPRTVCGVVGQKKQFAPGVLSKPMGAGRKLAAKTARLAMRGARHPEVGDAMFFHTAGYSYPYTNMQYVAIAGGNAFYEKRPNATSTQASVMARESRLPFEPPQRRAPEIRDAQRMPARRAEPVYVPDFGGQDLGGQAPFPASPEPGLLLAAPSRPADPRLPPMSVEDIILAGD